MSDVRQEATTKVEGRAQVAAATAPTNRTLRRKLGKQDLRNPAESSGKQGEQDLRSLV
jgi:hypothetical protein